MVAAVEFALVYLFIIVYRRPQLLLLPGGSTIVTPACLNDAPLPPLANGGEGVYEEAMADTLRHLNSSARLAEDDEFTNEERKFVTDGRPESPSPSGRPHRGRGSYVLLERTSKQTRMF